MIRLPLVMLAIWASGAQPLILVWHGDAGGVTSLILRRAAFAKRRRSGIHVNLHGGRVQEAAGTLRNRRVLLQRPGRTGVLHEHDGDGGEQQHDAKKLPRAGSCHV